MGRERVTISIQDTLVEKLDKLIDKQNVRNRSHAVEMLLTEALSASPVELGVVMIGGKMVGMTIPHVINAMKDLQDNAGISEFIIILGSYAKNVRTSLENEPKFRLKISFHETANGSGGGLKEIGKRLPNQFAVINIQEPCKINWELLKNYHKKFSAKFTLLQSRNSTLRGIALAKKDILDDINGDFSVLEENVLPKLLNQNELIVIPKIT